MTAADDNAPANPESYDDDQFSYLVPVTADRLRTLAIAAAGGVVAVLLCLSALDQPVVAAAVAACLLAALAGWCYLRLVPRSGIGVQLTEQAVRLGESPNDVVTIARADIASARVSAAAWNGERLPAAAGTFLIRGKRYLTITTTRGTSYHVAFDQASNAPTPTYAARQVADALHAEIGEPSAAVTTSAAEPLWQAAMARHDEVLLAYSPYETDPVVALTYPAISDVSVPETADFIEALHDAATLRAEEHGPGQVFEQYRDAVRRLVQTWRAAERNARQVGMDLLEAADARRLRQATKLLGHAERSTIPAERATYLRNAREIVDALILRKAIIAPPRIVAELESRSAAAIETAGSPSATEPTSGQ